MSLRQIGASHPGNLCGNDLSNGGSLKPGQHLELNLSSAALETLLFHYVGLQHNRN
jgi:hypothetical protein